jgi:hypothetical protein
MSSGIRSAGIWPAEVAGMASIVFATDVNLIEIKGKDLHRLAVARYVLIVDL